MNETAPAPVKALPTMFDVVMAQDLKVGDIIWDGLYKQSVEVIELKKFKTRVRVIYGNPGRGTISYANRDTVKLPKN